MMQKADLHKVASDEDSAVFSALSALDKKYIGADGWSAESFQSETAKDNGIVICCYDDDCIVGLISGYFAGDEADITSVAVDEKHRRHGIALQLIQEFEKSLPDYISEIFLEVRESNIPAISLYQKCGFEKLSIRKNFYENPTENAVVMVKKLTGNIKITAKYLYDLLYNKSNLELISVIKDITDSKLLHMIIANYNWDNGIEIPKTVIANSFCDLGTALMVFSFFGGYEFLFGDEKNVFSESEKIFLSDLQERIKNKKFSNQSIKYIPELTRTEKYHIKKFCPDISKIFLEGTEGELLDIIPV